MEGLDDFQCLMPALNESDGSWLQRPMTTAEGCYWLREFLYFGRCKRGSSHAVQLSFIEGYTLVMGLQGWRDDEPREKDPRTPLG